MWSRTALLRQRSAGGREPSPGAVRPSRWMRRFLLAVGWVMLAAGCTLSGPPVPSASVVPTASAHLGTLAAVVDCGVSDPRPPSIYPASGMECVWKAYAARMPVRWAVTQYTEEGAPVPSTIVFDGAAVLVTRDLSLDGFSGTADRRLWSWRCRTMTQRPWVTDPQRYSFDLGDCTGDSAPAHFP